MSPAIITLLTDFGTRDTYVGAMRGVILGITPQARLVDLTHEVPPQDVFAGAMLLANAVDTFPRETVHLAVVDPGVGSSRDPIVAVTERGMLVGPDNGLLEPAARRLGLVEVRVLDRPEWFRAPVSRTFHGRDVFAPVAAHLAAGVTPDRVGSPKAALCPLALPVLSRETGRICGEVIHVDHFGNLVTNIPAAALDDFPVAGLSVRVFDVSITALSLAYTAAPAGSLLAIIGSWGTLEIALRDGSAAKRLSAGRGTDVTVTSGPCPTTG